MARNSGYLFLYETTPSSISQDLVEDLLTRIEESNQQEIDVNNFKEKKPETKASSTPKEEPRKDSIKEGIVQLLRNDSQHGIRILTFWSLNPQEHVPT